MDKTREGLAKGYANRIAMPFLRSMVPSMSRTELASKLHDAHLAGFDAGFARAVELIRESIPALCSNNEWADWLEKQPK